MTSQAPHNAFLRYGLWPILLSFGCYLPVSAQTMGLPADSLAEEFQTAFQRLGWRAAAARMHSGGLAYFKRRITIFVDADESGETRALLFDEITAADYETLPDEEVFVRIMELFQEELPGLVNAWSAREIEILGQVPEGDADSHVLYRNTPFLNGSVPELRVMTLRREGGEWRVLETPELKSVPEALRGLINLLKRSTS